MQQQQQRTFTDRLQHLLGGLVIGQGTGEGHEGTDDDLLLLDTVLLDLHLGDGRGSLERSGSIGLECLVVEAGHGGLELLLLLLLFLLLLLGLGHTIGLGALLVLLLLLLDLLRLGGTHLDGFVSLTFFKNRKGFRKDDEDAAVVVVLKLGKSGSKQVEIFCLLIKRFAVFFLSSYRSIAELLILAAKFSKFFVTACWNFLRGAAGQSDAVLHKSRPISPSIDAYQLTLIFCMYAHTYILSSYLSNHLMGYLFVP